MITIFFYLFLAINSVFIFFLLFPSAVHLLSLLSPKKKLSSSERELDFACVITAYRNVEINVPLVDSILKQQYSNYHIYLVADRCEFDSFPIEHEKLSVLKPESPLNNKVKSIRYGVDHFVRDHHAVVVWDPDNLAHPKLLSRFNLLMQNGYKAVQGKRTAKNLDTIFSSIDAMCELYYNYAMRYNIFRAGSSSTIAGSGMAIQTDLFKKCLNLDRMDADGGDNFIDEDKVLQMGLVSKNTRIAFDPQAVIFDEKVDSAEQVEKQRSRWLSSHFQQMPIALGMALKGLFTLNWNKMLFGISTLYPPLFILALSSAFLLMADLIVFPNLFTPLLFAGIIFSLNFFLILKRAKAPKEVWSAIWRIPVFVSSQLRALFKIKRESGNSSPTQNTRMIKIDELLSEDQ